MCHDCGVHLWEKILIKDVEMCVKKKKEKKKFIYSFMRWDYGTSARRQPKTDDMDIIWKYSELQCFQFFCFFLFFFYTAVTNCPRHTTLSETQSGPHFVGLNFSNYYYYTDSNNCK